MDLALDFDVGPVWLTEERAQGAVARQDVEPVIAASGPKRKWSGINNPDPVLARGQG